MSLFTSLHDNVPTTLRGLTFFALSDTGYILRGTVTDNLGGGGTMTFGTAGTVACRVDPVAGGDREIADRIDDRTTHRITCPPLTNISSQDRFRVNGVDFEITAVRTRTDEQVRVLEAVKSL